MDTPTLLSPAADLDRADDDLDNLDDLVDAVVSLGPVEYAETVMCAKCIGECKIF